MAVRVPKHRLPVGYKYWQSLKIVGILEVDDSLDISTLLNGIHLSALDSCHPLLLPMALLEHHVQESATHFMAISQKLSSVEDTIDVLANEGVYGPQSKSAYECNNSLFELERRRDYERRLQNFLTIDLQNHGRDENRHKLENRLKNIIAVSNSRDLDMKSLPRRIEALTNLVSTWRGWKMKWFQLINPLKIGEPTGYSSSDITNSRVTWIYIRNLVAQQDSRANIQIARSTIIENTQMTALTKATLKDSNTMKNIAVLTRVFLPRTYMAVSPRSFPEF
jgi:hypothetical protein